MIFCIKHSIFNKKKIEQVKKIQKSDKLMHGIKRILCVQFSIGKEL